MAITHATVKAAGDKIRALLDWNAAHVGTATPDAHDIAGAAHTSAATSGRMLKANASGLPVDATDTDAAVSAAVTASHARQHAINAAADHTGTITLTQHGDLSGDALTKHTWAQVAGKPATYPPDTHGNAAHSPAFLSSCFVDRGDPAGPDFREWDLDQDSAFHDLDLSGIVPAGAKAVYLRVVVEAAGGSNRYIALRKKGNVNSGNMPSLRTQAAGAYNDQSVFVICDSNRVIQYFVDGGFTLDFISITVMGWVF
jgi:hypothetical protein